MTGFFAVGVYIYVHHGHPIRSLDLVSRYLMAVPVFILLVHHRPKAEWMWAGVIVGCLSAAGVTIWQTVVLNLPRAPGSTGVIQFGEIGRASCRESVGQYV